MCIPMYFLYATHIHPRISNTPMFMCIYIHMRIHIYIYICMIICIYVCTHVYTCIRRYIVQMHIEHMNGPIMQIHVDEWLFFDTPGPASAGVASPAKCP